MSETGEFFVVAGVGLFMFTAVAVIVWLLYRASRKN